jgi:hypothetical protein
VKVLKAPQYQLVKTPALGGETKSFLGKTKRIIV